MKKLLTKLGILDETSEMPLPDYMKNIKPSWYFMWTGNEFHTLIWRFYFGKTFRHWCFQIGLGIIDFGIAY